MSHILVIGAGITGITSAHALLRRGHTVTILEQRRYPAMETSYANGGQLSASNAEVWNNWATMRKGVQWMMRADAPLLMNPRPSLQKYGWLAEFVGQIRHYRANSIATTQLAIAARQHLFDMAEEEGIEFDLERRGILHLYHDARTFRRAERANRLLQAGGLERHAVTDAEIHGIEPSLNGRFYGGFFTPADATGDIHKFTRGLAAACVRRGALLRTHATVTDLTANDMGVAATLSDGERIEADALLICAGVASRAFARQLGDRVNIYPVKGYSITVGLDDIQSQKAAPTVSLLDEDAKIVTSRLGADRFRVAGTAEFNGYNRDIRADRIAPLVRWVETLFPAMSTSAIVPWTGLRPMTPNMLPKVGRGRRPRVYYNTGHGHLGWTLSAVTAQTAADRIDQDMAVCR